MSKLGKKAFLEIANFIFWGMTGIGLFSLWAAGLSGLLFYMEKFPENDIGFFVVGLMFLPPSIVFYYVTEKRIKEAKE